MGAFVADTKKLKYVRGNRELVVLTDTGFDRVEVVVRHLDALDISTLLANQMVMVVIFLFKFVSLHAVENVYLGYDSIVYEEFQLSVDRGFVNGWVLSRDSRQKLLR